MTTDNPLVMTEEGLLTEFLNQHSQRTDRPFFFILGAGASRASGIPTGAELASTWLREIHTAEDFEGLELAVWATPERLGIPSFSTEALGRFYPQLYQRRFGDLEQAGYAFLESQMEGKEPSYGYSVLAYLLSDTAHRIVVTTNFDNLVADALSIHSNKFPLVVGHDALADYAVTELRRPLVAKIHGALGFAPKSQPDQIAQLPAGWQGPLHRILGRCTPIVIGYDGNDGSLMAFLQGLPDGIPDRVFWCVYAPGAGPDECVRRVSEEVREFVHRKRGRLVPIRGFDELMARLLSKLREKGTVPDLYERLKQRARNRESAYDDQQRRLFEATSGSIDSERPAVASSTNPAGDTALRRAVSEIAESRREKPWWVWAREIQDETNPEKQRAVLAEALEAHPRNSHLLRTSAMILANHGKPDEAEKMYVASLEESPNDATTLTFYADFLQEKKRDFEQAEKFYKKALEAAPNDEYMLTRYADFLDEKKNDAQAADEYFRRALASNPRYNFALITYAEFVQERFGDSRKAESLFERAIEADPHDAYAYERFARFTRNILRDETRTGVLLEKAKQIKRAASK